MINRFLLSLLLILLWLSTSFAASQDRLPTSDVSGDWNDGGCVTNAWSCVDDPIGSPDDANYIARADSNNTQMFEYTDFAITSTAITNVMVTARCREVGGNITVNFRLRVSGVETYVAGGGELTVNWETYPSGFYSYAWTTNPATSNPWTEAEIEGAALEGFGVYPTNIVGGETIQCSQVYITVNYTAPASSTNPALFNSGEDWE